MNPKILICEDHPDSQTVIKNCLSKRNYDIAIAGDGQEAIEKVKTFTPDLILMDIRMPKLNGIEAIKEIRGFDKKVKVIFITAFQSPQLSQEAEKYGISGYIVKPASPEGIIKAIETALAATD